MTTNRPASDERGFQMLEFAIVAPVALLVILGMIYALIAAAAQVSLTHATSVAARYAVLPTDPASNAYPTTEAVTDRIASSTPFFTAGDCTTNLTGDTAQNTPVHLEVSCGFPNPLGRTVGALMQLAVGQRPGHQGVQDRIDMTATAAARRE